MTYPSFQSLDSVVDNKYFVHSKQFKKLPYIKATLLIVVIDVTLANTGIFALYDDCNFALYDDCNCRSGAERCKDSIKFVQ